MSRSPCGMPFTHRGGSRGTTVLILNLSADGSEYSRPLYSRERASVPTIPIVLAPSLLCPGVWRVCRTENLSLPSGLEHKSVQLKASRSQCARSLNMFKEPIILISMSIYRFSNFGIVIVVGNYVHTCYTYVYVLIYVLSPDECHFITPF
jgi:hypothetical protein